MIKMWTSYKNAIKFLFFKLFVIGNTACAQIPSDRPHCKNADFDKEVSRTISFTVPLISCEALKRQINEVILFDTRSRAEYDVSHIEKARYLGYDDFLAAQLNNLPKHTPIVVYCSIGYRSEKIGEKLQKLGYTNVKNLFGSIFEWVNTGNKIVDKNDSITTKIHTYNKNWSKWVDKNKAQRLW